jgi:hypothetical protein
MAKSGFARKSGVMIVAAPPRVKGKLATVACTYFRVWPRRLCLALSPEGNIDNNQSRYEFLRRERHNSQVRVVVATRDMSKKKIGAPLPAQRSLSLTLATSHGHIRRHNGHASLPVFVTEGLASRPLPIKSRRPLFQTPHSAHPHLLPFIMALFNQPDALPAALPPYVASCCFAQMIYANSVAGQSL